MLDFGVEIPFVELLGFELVRMQDGESELHYEARPEHLNSFGVTHGGASMTLLTIEMKTSFMQAAQGPLVAKGRLIHRTATMAFTEATVFDAKGRPCTHATGTFKYVRRLPVGPGYANELRAIATD